LKVSESRMLRRMVGSSGNEVTRQIKILHKEGRHNLYVSPNVTRAMKSKWNELGRTCRYDGGDGNCTRRQMLGHLNGNKS
jgi:hypothetical protein